MPRPGNGIALVSGSSWWRNEYTIDSRKPASLARKRSRELRGGYFREPKGRLMAIIL
jgi:hypothetical protein